MESKNPELQNAINTFSRQTIWLFIVKGEVVDAFANEIDAFREYYRATQADKTSTNPYKIKVMYLNE